MQPARLHCELDTTATRSSCRSPSHVSRVQHRTTGTQDHTTSLRRSLPRGRADKDSLTRSALDGRTRVMSDQGRPADLRPDLRVRRCFFHRQQRQAICWTATRCRTCPVTAGQSGVTLLHAGHIGRAERREHARHAGFSSPRQADSISASGAAALPVQPARLYCELDTTATRSSCRSSSHASRVHSRTTGIQDHTTSLRRSLPRGRADKGSLTSSALDDCIGVMSN